MASSSSSTLSYSPSGSLVGRLKWFSVVLLVTEYASSFEEDVGVGVGVGVGVEELPSEDQVEELGVGASAATLSSAD